MGLRATGSIDYTTDKVCVPEAYTHFAITETPKRGGGLYRVGIIGFAAMCHSGWALGIGRVGSILGPFVGGWLLASSVDFRHVFWAAAVPPLLACCAALAAAAIMRGRERRTTAGAASIERLTQ